MRENNLDCMASRAEGRGKACGAAVCHLVVHWQRQIPTVSIDQSRVTRLQSRLVIRIGTHTHHAHASCLAPLCLVHNMGAANDAALPSRDNLACFRSTRRAVQKAGGKNRCCSHGCKTIYGGPLRTCCTYMLPSCFATNMQNALNHIQTPCGLAMSP